MAVPSSHTDKLKMNSGESDSEENIYQDSDPSTKEFVHPLNIHFLMSASPIEGYSPEQKNVLVSVNKLLGDFMEFGNPDTYNHSRDFAQNCCEICVFAGQNSEEQRSIRLENAKQSFHDVSRHEKGNLLTLLSYIYRLLHHGYGQQRLATEIFRELREFAHEVPVCKENNFVEVAIDFFVGPLGHGWNSQCQLNRLANLTKVAESYQQESPQFSAIARYLLACELLKCPSPAKDKDSDKESAKPDKNVKIAIDILRKLCNQEDIKREFRLYAPNCQATYAQDMLLAGDHYDALLQINEIT